MCLYLIKYFYTIFNKILKNSYICYVSERLGRLNDSPKGILRFPDTNKNRFMAGVFIHRLFYLFCFYT